MHLVVGVDGSPDAAAALVWARQAAGPAGAIHAVHAISPHEDRATAEGILADWVAAALHGSDGVALDVIVDDPTGALLRLADEDGADAIVVGAHGRSLIVPRTIGTVASHLLPIAPRPVVVVRRGAVRPLGPDGSIVVGVGHSEATRAALRWAAEFATERTMALSLVRATGTRPLFDESGLLELMAYYIDPTKVREWAEEDLAELADELERSADGRLRVSWTATSGRAGPRLVDAAADAALLIIGRHRDGSITEHFTVAALHHALAHAPCPVVIVPAPNDE